jgi:hypothetical protein
MESTRRRRLHPGGRPDRDFLCRYALAAAIALAGATQALACTEDEKTELKQWGCSSRQIEKKCGDITAGSKSVIPRRASLQPYQPAQGVLKTYTRKPLLAPLRVKTPAGENYFIKLVEANNKKTTVMTMFIFGGGSFQTKVPLGTYVLRYATGADWYGPDYLFGVCKTSFYEADADLAFTQSGRALNGHHVELIKQVDGNLETRDIDEAEF